MFSYEVIFVYAICWAGIDRSEIEIDISVYDLFRYCSTISDPSTEYGFSRFLNYA